MKKLLAFILTLVMVASTFTMLPLSVSANTATPELLTYSQGYAGQPEGSGTKDDPYQIATADDLLWMSKQLISNVDTNTPGTTAPSFAKALTGFFKQTADIDLGGKVMPSIGFFSAPTGEFTQFDKREAGGTAKYATFDGTYDGCGYSITNGYVGSVIPSATTLQTRHLQTWYWGTGLFGVIHGATIKNINLEKISLYRSENCDVTYTGLLVGNAISDKSSKNVFNSIINCHISETCSISITGMTGRDNVDASSIFRVGGIVGSANACTITNCTNNADIKVDEVVGAVGGIAGAIADVTMTNCVNYGDISIDSADFATVLNGTFLDWRCIGGIAGTLARCDQGVMDESVYNDATLTNCYNAGDIIMTTSESDATVASSYALGGIVGMTRRMRLGNVLEMTNCYNSGIFTTPANMATEAYRAEGAIIGLVSVSTEKIDGTGIGYVTLENVVSAPVVTKTSTEEISDAKLNENGTALKTVKDGDVAMYSAYNTTVSGVAGIATVADVITATDCGITTDTAKLAKEADMVAACDLGIQAHSTDAGKYRFFATIDGLNWDEAGFNITVNNGNKSVTKEFFVTVAYNSIEENDVTVTDINGRKFIVLVLENVEADWTFEINAYVEDSTGTYPTTTWTGEFG